jgi:hypothetical protein
MASNTLWGSASFTIGRMHSPVGDTSQEIISAGREPQEFQPVLQFGIVEDGFLLVLKTRPLRVAARPARKAKYPRTVNTEVGELVEVRDAQVQRLRTWYAEDPLR